MFKKIISSKITIIIVLIIVALISFFGISKVASSVKFHEHSIQVLDSKKMTVMKLTGATAAASTALAAFPGDATTPLANQIMELSKYLLFIVGAIFLEKMLLTLTGYISFRILIPLGCILFAIYLWFGKIMLKNLSIKLITFGLIIFAVVPFSVKICDIIETTYKDSINTTIEDAESIETTDETSSSGIKGLINSVSSSVSTALAKGEKALSNLIDAIAVLIITTCVIPIAVIIFLVWVIKMIFGINIPLSKVTEIKMPQIKKTETEEPKEKSSKVAKVS